MSQTLQEQLVAKGLVPPERAAQLLMEKRLRSRGVGSLVELGGWEAARWVKNDLPPHHGHICAWCGKEGEHQASPIEAVRVLTARFGPTKGAEARVCNDCIRRYYGGSISAP